MLLPLCLSWRLSAVRRFFVSSSHLSTYQSLKVWGEVVRTQPTDFLTVGAVTMETRDLSLAASGFLTGHSPYLLLTSWLSSCFVYLSLAWVNRLWYSLYGGILDLPIGDYYLSVREKMSILMNLLNHSWIICCPLSINNNSLYFILGAQTL